MSNSAPNRIDKRALQSFLDSIDDELNSISQQKMSQFKEENGFDLENEKPIESPI